MVDCDICGDPHKLKYVHKLSCGHTYHYECIQKTFICDRKRKNTCPLCRGKNGLLPLVNGLPRLINGIHYMNKYPDNYQCSPCEEVLKSGIRKGLACGAKCMVGLQVCKRHHLSKIKKESAWRVRESEDS